MQSADLVVFALNVLYTKEENEYMSANQIIDSY